MKNTSFNWSVCVSTVIIVLFFILLILTIIQRVVAEEHLSRESAILNIVTPTGRSSGKLPYSSKRIQAYKDRLYREKLVSAFESAAMYFQVPANLLIAMAYRETVFRPQLEGGGGERGIMQLKPYSIKRCKQYCHENDTAEGGIWCGACWFAKNVERCDGDLEAGVSAYVSGSCVPMARNVKMAVRNRVWLWKHLDKLTGENDG